MKIRVCPCCDQPIKGIYCKGCKKLVLHPVEQNIHYYLNERHPEFEADCTFHGDTTARRTAAEPGAYRGETRPMAEVVRRSVDVSRERDGEAPRMSDQKMTGTESEAKKREIRERMEARKREQAASREASAGSRPSASERTFPEPARSFRRNEPAMAGNRAGGRRNPGKRHVWKWLLFPIVIFLLPMIISLIVFMSISTSQSREYAVPEPLAPALMQEIPVLPEVDAAEEVALPDIGAFENAGERRDDGTTTGDLFFEGAKRDGEPCDVYGHFDQVYEDMQYALYDQIFKAGLLWKAPMTTENVYDYGDGTFLNELLYSYEIYDDDGYVGMLEVSTDGESGQIHGFSMYTSDRSGFFAMFEAVWNLLWQNEMAEMLPSDCEGFYRTMIEEYADDNYGTAVFLFGGLEYSAYVPEDTENPDFYSLWINVPAVYPEEP